MSLLGVFALLLGAFAILVTALSFSRSQAWWARACDFPRAQVAFLGLVAMIAWWWATAHAADSGVKRLLFGGALSVAVGWQLYRMSRFSPLCRAEFKKTNSPIERDQISFLFSNVLMDNRDYGRLLAFIDRKDPDVILAVECDAAWDAQLNEHLAERYPYSKRQPQDDTYGMVFYSRLELVDPQIRFIRRDNAPSIHCGIRLKNGIVMRFHGLHPEPPMPEFATDTKQRDAELIMVAEEVNSEIRPTVVGGDLNDVAWSDTTRLFQKISGLLDPRVGRRPMSTFPANMPGLRFPLDHVFCSRHFQLVDFEIGPNIGSDHLPVFIRVQHAPTEAVRNEMVEENAEDRREAAVKVAAAKQAEAS